MSAITTDRLDTERISTRRIRTERTTWVCDNCEGITATVRKRCQDCGTSRY